MIKAKDTAHVTKDFPLYASLRIRQALLGVLMLVIVGTVQNIQAQGIERESLAGESAAADASGSDVNQPYNLQLGPVTLRANASLQTAFNDNINLAKNGRLADCIITPQFGVDASWQISDLNKLTFGLALGYDAYLEHSANNSIIIAPDSELLLNVFVGDFKISPYDKFSYQTNPISIGALSGVSQFNRFTNDAGVVVDWDLGDAILSLGYNHENFWVFENSFSYLDYESDSATPQVDFKLSQTIDVGINTMFSNMTYDHNIQNNNTSVSAGPFVNAKITENLSATAQAGWYYTDYSRGGLNGDKTDIDSFYASGGINQRVNDVVTQSLTAGREYIPGITSNFTDRIYANYSPSWQATDFLTLSGNLWWENLSDSNAIVRETANRYGVGLNLSYNVAEHQNLTLGYQFVLKDADPSLFSYYQNLLTLSYRYQF